MKRFIRGSLNKLGYDIRKIGSRPEILEPQENVIFFLHIGKNAGMQIDHLSKQIEERAGVKIVKADHSVTLGKLPGDSRYFFSIRDPESRFKSAFYSRKRKGQPRFYSEWSRDEAVAFSDFEHANDLAEGLFANGERGRKAMEAVQSISHTAMQQVDWFRLRGYFFEQRPPIWIIRQENFNEDFEEFLKRAKLPIGLADLDLAKDAVKAHRNDYSSASELSDLARSNLQKWYARDYEFYRICVDWMNAQKSA